MTLGPLGAGIEQLAAAVDRAESVEPAAEEPASPADPEARRPPRRRKKRRRPRRGEAVESERGPGEEESAGDTEVLEADEETVFSAAEEEDRADEEAPGGAEGPGKRRRRRRGNKSARPEAEAAEEGGEADEPDVSKTKAVTPAGAEKKKERAAHRGIPTWEETIDLIISKNIEVRGKSRNGGSPRHRGGRKGGRRRAPDKSS
jgi:ribonuclease E